MARCDRCGKGVLVGMNVSHSHVRTKKRSYPNLHRFTVGVGGSKRRLRLCTKCLRIVKKQQAAVLTKKAGKPLVVESQEKLQEKPEEKTTLDEAIEKAAEKKSKESTKAKKSPA